MIISSDQPRRMYCSLLSRFYAARLIVGAQNINFSTFLFATRKWCRCDDQWFYGEKHLQQNAEYYDQVIEKPKSQAIYFELQLAFLIISQKVSFTKVKQNIRFITDPVPKVPRNTVTAEHLVITCDASKNRYGIFLEYQPKETCLVFGGAFSEKVQVKSINYKELWALALALLNASCLNTLKFKLLGSYLSTTKRHELLPSKGVLI